MKKSAAVSNAIIEKAALIGAKARWGAVTIGQGVPIMGLADDNPRAYVFTVAFGKSNLDKDAIAGHVSKHIQKFAKSYKSLRNMESPDKSKNEKVSKPLTRFQQFNQARKTLLAVKEFGTIVVGINRDLYPIIMTYKGLPFTMIGSALIREIHGTNEKFNDKAAPVFRMGDGTGYPHFFADFHCHSGEKKRFSLLDGFRANYQLPTPRPVLPISKKSVLAYRKLWKLFECLKPNHISKVSPKYLEKAPDPIITGVPDLVWYRGCAPTSAGNILAYWDARGYSLLVDNPPQDENDLIDQLADAMGTNSEGGTKDMYCDDGIRSVCNYSQYGNNYDFAVNGADGDDAWGKIVGEIDAGRPCHLILHGHAEYRDHSVTVVGYRIVYWNINIFNIPVSIPLPHITIHDTWPNTWEDVEINFAGDIHGTIDGCEFNNGDEDWLVTTVVPGKKQQAPSQISGHHGKKKSMISCIVSSEVEAGAGNDERWLYKMLASKNAVGPIADGFRSLYRDPVLYEEFNAIIGKSAAHLEEYGRTIRFLSYLVRAMNNDEQTMKNFPFPNKTVTDFIKCLSWVCEQASPKLARYLNKIVTEFGRFGGLSMGEAMKLLWPK